MTKQNLERELKRELEVLNNIIDSKIIKGLSYSKEARRHKIVLSSLANIRRSQSYASWFMKPSGSFSLL